MEAKRVEGLGGGKGPALTVDLLLDPQARRHCRLYSQITLPPGSSVGYHEHRNESETYYILSGSGLYQDNGAERRVGPGDATFTGHGQFHGIINDTDQDLVFMALILLDENATSK